MEISNEQNQAIKTYKFNGNFFLLPLKMEVFQIM